MKTPEQKVPRGAEKLVNNLERRKQLLEKIKGEKTSEIPEILITDVFLRFLDREYQERNGTCTY